MGERSKEGLFDVELCKEMDTLIKNHKPVDKSNKRVQKHEEESVIL